MEDFMYSFKHHIPIIESASKIDLKLYYCGTEDCDGGHSWGPAVKDHFKIHYVHSGKGVLKVDNKVYNISKGQCFLINPGKVSFYKADDLEPWTYYWVAFSGINAESYLLRSGFSESNPIISTFRNEEIINCFESMFKNSLNKKAGDILMLSNLYSFLSILTEDNLNDVNISNKSANIYIQKALELIEMNFSSNLSISEIADNIGINRKYFSKLFKEAMGVTPVEYLINFRLNKACSLMKSQNLSIAEIACSVGYSDQFLFARTFKKFIGVSPTEFRKQK